MIAGRGTPDQAPARLFAYRHPRSVSASHRQTYCRISEYLLRQIEAARSCADFRHMAGFCLQSSSNDGALSRSRRSSPDSSAKTKPSASSLSERRRPRLQDFARQTGVDALGLDSSVDPAWAGENLDKRLVARKSRSLALSRAPALEASAQRILSPSNAAHIFNSVTHPAETPLEHVRFVIRSQGRCMSGRLSLDQGSPYRAIISGWRDALSRASFVYHAETPRARPGRNFVVMERR